VKKEKGSIGFFSESHFGGRAKERGLQKQNREKRQPRSWRGEEPKRAEKKV